MKIPVDQMDIQQKLEIVQVSLIFQLMIPRVKLLKILVQFFKDTLD